MHFCVFVVITKLDWFFFMQKAMLSENQKKRDKGIVVYIYSTPSNSTFSWQLMLTNHSLDQN